MAATCGDRGRRRRETELTDLVEARNSARRTVSPFGGIGINEGGWAHGFLCRAQFSEGLRSLVGWSEIARTNPRSRGAGTGSRERRCGYRGRTNDTDGRNSDVAAQQTGIVQAGK